MQPATRSGLRNNLEFPLKKARCVSAPGPARSWVGAHTLEPLLEIARHRSRPSIAQVLVATGALLARILPFRINRTRGGPLLQRYRVNGAARLVGCYCSQLLARDFAQLSDQACRALLRMCRRPPLIRSFWRQAKQIPCDKCDCRERGPPLAALSTRYLRFSALLSSDITIGVSSRSDGESPPKSSTIDFKALPLAFTLAKINGICPSCSHALPCHE